MQRLKQVAAFGNAGFTKRVMAVAAWGMTHVWDHTFGALGDAMNSMCEWLESLFSGGAPQLPSFVIAPEYLSFSTVTEAWKESRGFNYDTAVENLKGFFVTSASAVVRGGKIASALASVAGVSRDACISGAMQVANVPSGHGHMAHVVLDDGPMSITHTRPAMTPGGYDLLQEALVADLRALNVVDEPPVDRHHMPTETVVRVVSQTEWMTPDFDLDPDYVGTLNEVYEVFNPGVAQQPLERDIASLSFDPQDRHLMADYLRMPRLMDSAPRDREYYRSKILALGVPKRQETQQELLSSVAARNLNAPKISLPQDQTVLIKEIWGKFLSVACVDGAKDKLVSYQQDPVALEEDAYRDWVSKAKPGNVQAVKKELELNSQALGEMPVGEYLMMLKSDVKPPLGDKPLHGRVEPQVIVYHDKALSAMYSSIFRVLVRRFLSLLKPNYHINLLKDSRDITQFLQALHPFGQKLDYLENDFSKYDKSQDEFVFMLEEYVFRQLGMNEELLQKWVAGHVECSIRSFTTGMSLHVRFQRKSGDATTAFGNVILNVLSVCYAYSPTAVVWAVFMGDDSLVASVGRAFDERAVAILAEVFNLAAKMYVTDAPYFASSFLVVDDVNCNAVLVPDPIKWIEKRSQMVDAADPQWKERFVSAADACEPYKFKINTEPLARLVAQRHKIPLEEAVRLPAAIATAISSQERFRGCYEDKPEVIHY
jgi:hypothetical protein